MGVQVSVFFDDAEVARIERFGVQKALDRIVPKLDIIPFFSAF